MGASQSAEETSEAPKAQDAGVLDGPVMLPGSFGEQETVVWTKVNVDTAKASEIPISRHDRQAPESYPECETPATPSDSGAASVRPTPDPSTSYNDANLEVREIKPGDIVIAVLGITGAGKTTFINHFATIDVKIGHGLEPCTQKVQAIPCKFMNGSHIWLVDTPGFDDTYRSDAEILEELATWLNTAYKKSIQLTGIIYLHRIKDVRVGGAAMKNLRMFKQLCGDHGLASVVLATTMWDAVPEQTGTQREEELMSNSDFWQYLIEQKSKVFRQDQGEISAHKIVRYLVEKNRPVTLDISREMVDEKKQLHDTRAGNEVAVEAERMKKFYEEELQCLRRELEDAVARKDVEAKKTVEKLQADFERKLARSQDDLRILQADNEKLYLDAHAKHEEEIQELKRRMQEKDQQIEEAKRRNEDFRDLEKYKKDLEATLKRQYKEMVMATRCIVM